MSPGDGAGAVGLFLDGDAEGILGQEFFDELGPFYEAEVAAVEIVFVAHVIDFLKLLDAVEIEMIKSPLGGEAVFIDDGEGGGGDDVFHAEFFTEGFDEGGLTGSHLAVEGYDETFVVDEAVGGDELAGCLTKAYSYPLF